MSSNENKFYVYEWIRLDTNEPFYVGKGKDDRCYTLTRGNNQHFNNIVKSIPCVVNILHDNLEEQVAYDLEAWYINEYRDIIGYDLCNINDGGEGQTLCGELNGFHGKTHTEEWKQEHSKRMSGENNPMFGVRYAEEKRKVIGDRQRGEKSCWFGVIGENHPRFGVKATDETRKLISENHADISGVNNPRAEKIGLIDIDTNTILYFDTNKQCNDYLIDLLKLNSKRIAIYNYKDKKIYKKKYLFVSLNENYEIKNKDFVNNYIIIDKLRIVA